MLVSCGASYDERIEEKYDVEVLSVEPYSGTVVFRKPSGEVCSAAQLPDDVLIEAGCSEVDSRAS
jgi:hypothetical protein